MRISDWSSDVCSSDLPRAVGGQRLLPRDAGRAGERHGAGVGERDARRRLFDPIEPDVAIDAAVFVPILLDLDVKVEVDGVAEQRGKLGAGLGAAFLDTAALLSERAPALGGPRAEDLLVGFYRAVVAFLFRLGLH